MKRVKLFLLTICISIFSLNCTFSQEDKEILQFAKTLEKSIIRRDITSFNNLFDYNQFFQSIIPQEFHNEEFNEFNQYFIRELEQGVDMAEMIFNVVNNQKQFIILNYFKYDNLINNQYGIWFRLYSPPSGLNYFRFEVTKENESFRIKDIYVSKSGEYISESLKYHYYQLLSVAADDKEINERPKDVKDFIVIDSLYKIGNYGKAIQVYEKMTTKIKNMKTVRFIGLQMYRLFNQDAYIKQVGEYEKLFPNDPSLYLLLIDKYLLEKKYDDVFPNIDKLYDAIGKDNFLNLLRGRVYFLKKDMVQAENCFRQLIKDYPQETYTFYAYDYLARALAYQGKHKESIAYLDKIINDFGISKESIISSFSEETEQLYKDFVVSKAFQKWLKN